jgi:hypothetical protein
VLGGGCCRVYTDIQPCEHLIWKGEIDLDSQITSTSLDCRYTPTPGYNRQTKKKLTPKEKKKQAWAFPFPFKSRATPRPVI